MKKIFWLTLILIMVCGCNSNNDSNGGTISYMEAKEKIINDGAIMVDVRTKEEYDNGHIGGAVLLTLDDINEEKALEILGDKNKTIIVYCKSGVRSKEASQKLADLGYKSVYDLGAMSNWKE